MRSGGVLQSWLIFAFSIALALWVAGTVGSSVFKTLSLVRVNVENASGGSR